MNISVKPSPLSKQWTYLSSPKKVFSCTCVISSSRPTWLQAVGKVQVCSRCLNWDWQPYEVYSYPDDGRRIHKTSCFMTTNIPVTKTSHMAKPYIEVVGKNVLYSFQWDDLHHYLAKDIDGFIFNWEEIKHWEEELCYNK